MTFFWFIIMYQEWMLLSQTDLAQALNSLLSILQNEIWNQNLLYLTK